MGSEVKVARKAWSRTIEAVDRHANTCKSCNKKRYPHELAVQTGSLTDPKVEAYRLCRKGKSLYVAERAAYAAYIAAGGRLPAVTA